MFSFKTKSLKTIHLLKLYPPTMSELKANANVTWLQHNIMLLF